MSAITLNSTVYIFGTNSGSRFQYPYDYTNKIFEEFDKSVSSQIVVVRSGHIAYYNYIRKVRNGSIGICVLLNGCIFRSAKPLFSLFETAVSSMALAGRIVDVDKDGSLYIKNDDLLTELGEVDRVVEEVERAVANCAVDTVPMPPRDLSVSCNECKFLPADGDEKDFLAAQNRYCKVQVSNDADADTRTLSNYRQRLRVMNEKIGDLESRLSKSEKQKKQYKMVLALALAILLGGVLFFLIISNKNTEIGSLNMDVRSLNQELETKNWELEQCGVSVEKLRTNSLFQSRKIVGLRDSVTDLCSTIENLNSQLDESRSTVERLKLSPQSGLPFRVKDIEIGNIYKDGTIETNYGNTLYSSRTMYLQPKVYCQGSGSGSYTIYIKLYRVDGDTYRLSTGTSSPSGYSTYGTYSIYEGSNSVTLSGWGNESKGHWSSGKYMIEIWWNDMCLGHKYFTIY